MIVYWFEFKTLDEIKLPVGTKLGCGVTAYDKDDAINMMKKLIFKGWDKIPISLIKENISLDDLEQNHVKPNIGNIMVRGIWFPNLGTVD